VGALAPAAVAAAGRLAAVGAPGAACWGCGAWSGRGATCSSRLLVSPLTFLHLFLC